jgi:hypothetical protein
MQPGRDTGRHRGGVCSARLPGVGSSEPGGAGPGTIDTRRRRGGSCPPRASASGGRLAAVVALAVAGGVALLLAVPVDALAQSGNRIGENLGDLLKRNAGQVYGGVTAIVGLVFLINRRYTELVVFLLAALVVGWLVFSPDLIANQARQIARELFGVASPVR